MSIYDAIGNLDKGCKGLREILDQAGEAITTAKAEATRITTPPSREGRSGLEQLADTIKWVGPAIEEATPHSIKHGSLRAYKRSIEEKLPILDALDGIMGSVCINGPGRSEHKREHLIETMDKASLAFTSIDMDLLQIRRNVKDDPAFVKTIDATRAQLALADVYNKARFEKFMRKESTPDALTTGKLIPKDELDEIRKGKKQHGIGRDNWKK